MKSIKYYKLILDDCIIEFHEYKDVEGSIKYVTRDKLSKEEWKAFIFGNYNSLGKFEMRKEIELFGISNDKLELGKKIIIKDGDKRELGQGTIKMCQNIKENEYHIVIEELEVFVEGKPYNKIEELFKYIDIEFKNCPSKLFREKVEEYNKNKNNINEKLKFINGLFKISYYSIYYYFKNYYYNEKGETPGNKFSAYCSYEAIKKVLTEKGYKVSQLDSFVKGYKLEYDALIIKRNVDSNLRLYNPDDVVATIEIKTSGYFTSNKEDEKDRLKEDFSNYMKSQKIPNIPHIYISLHESISSNMIKNYYYNTYNALLNLNDGVYIPMFCKIKDKNDYINIPIEYDLDELIKRIK